MELAPSTSGGQTLTEVGGGGPRRHPPEVVSERAEATTPARSAGCAET
jgi:hypothetical protein